MRTPIFLCTDRPRATAHVPGTRTACAPAPFHRRFRVLGREIFIKCTCRSTSINTECKIILNIFGRAHARNTDGLALKDARAHVPPFPFSEPRFRLARATELRQRDRRARANAESTAFLVFEFLRFYGQTYRSGVVRTNCGL